MTAALVTHPWRTIAHLAAVAVALTVIGRALDPR